ncbi:MAG: efflux RND transporter periplasmic adaptor subunit [Bacteroidaceae bacterium]|nr:efflux RND transporter periplasmic adaptor subunit [Bacteroidaceae bacterium]
MANFFSSTKNKITTLAVLVAVGGGIFYFCSGKSKTTAQAYCEMAAAEISTISSSITATGTIEPVTSVEVGTQVSGIINKILVDYNDVVKRGQVIAILDKTNLESELASATSNLKSAESDLNYQKWSYERQEALHKQGDISDNAFQQAQVALRQAQAAYNMRVEAVKKAQTNLSYATITSPIDGVILSRAVEEGQTVAASFNTPTLFTIAQDLTDMRVIAKVDEADIGGVHEGQRVEFSVDAFPNDLFNGRVTQVRQEATTENNVVTYEVVISAPNPDLKLKPGLTANVKIITLEVKDVLAVPSKALRFAPVPHSIDKDEVIEDCQGTMKVWMRQGKTYKAYAVETGITNGILTEIKGGLNEGDSVIIDRVTSSPEEMMGAQRSPFMPGPRNNKKK